MTGNPLIRWLLSLESVPGYAPDVRLAWEHQLPAWAVAGIAAAAAAAAWFAYRGVQPRGWRRNLLVALRASTLLAIAALMAGPVVEVPRETVDPDAVIVLVDRSRSMEVEDADDGKGGFRSRDAALRSITGPGGPFSSLGREHRVEWIAFSDGSVPLPVGPEGPSLGQPSGDRSLLASALGGALDRGSGRAVAALVLLTDGRTTEPPDRTLVRRLQSEGIAVSAVAFGAPEALGDMSIASVQAPRRAFPRDLVPVEVEVERKGPARDRAVRAELIDLSSGAVLDVAELPPSAAAGKERVQLVARPNAPGDARWEVRLSSGGTRDLLPANDRRSIPVTLVDRPMRVLYVEGYPRWEYRYLKNLLQRERTVESAVMLLSADREFAQEGNTPISRLPRTREEFDRFDLFIIGDLPASFFTGEQLAEIRRAVAERGAGLAWIGGERSTPRTWGGSALEELLPFGAPFELERIGTAVNLAPTPQAARLGVLRMADDPKGGFPGELSSEGQPWAALEWVQLIRPRSLKPTSEVLAATEQSVEGSPAPVVLSMRYGAGNSLYVATDEVWRWRNGRGEAYPERFWVQLLRSLARPALGSGTEEVRIAAEPARATVGESVRVEVELPAGIAPAAIVMEAMAEDPSTPSAEFELTPASAGGFEGRWTPEVEGRWTIRPRDPGLASRAGAGSSVEAVRNDRELRDAEADPALLRSIAAETGGTVVTPDKVMDLVMSIPNRSIRTENPVRDPLRHSPVALGLVVLLLAAEWAFRRSWRLA